MTKISQKQRLSQALCCLDRNRCHKRMTAAYRTQNAHRARALCLVAPCVGVIRAAGCPRPLDSQRAWAPGAVHWEHLLWSIWNRGATGRVVTQDSRITGPGRCCCRAVPYGPPGPSSLNPRNANLVVFYQLPGREFAPSAACHGRRVLAGPSLSIK